MNSGAVEWRDVVGYEGRYRVSSEGEVLSLYSGEMMSQRLNREKGYNSVTLRDGARQKKETVHRLVALAFVENDDPSRKTQVDHVDGNRLNNKASNLEWVTPSENCRRAIALGLRDDARKATSERMKRNSSLMHAREVELGVFERQKIPVVRSDGREFPDMTSAAAETGCAISQVSQSVSTHGAFSANGYTFAKRGDDLSRSRASARSAGTRFEREVADYLSHVLGDVDIDRQVKMGRKDVGDVRGVYFRGERVVVECKNHKKRTLGEWIKEAEIEAGNADTPLSCVVHKRHGVGDPSKQYVTMTLETFASFIAGGHDLLEGDR